MKRPFYMLSLLLATASLVPAQMSQSGSPSAGPDPAAAVAFERALKPIESDDINPNEVFVPLADGLSRAVGDNCTTPIVVSIPAQLPYTDPNQTTCGRLNDYSNTCLGSYDGGEDIIYQLNVSVTTAVQITMNPKTTTYTGILLDNICPPNVTTCLAAVYNSGTTLRVITYTLNPGSYYIMCDTWPSPTCITNFDLSITVPPPQGACCTGNTCTITGQATCTGLWMGAGTTCTPSPCRPCATCTPPDVILDPIGNVPWYVINGTCADAGKWVGLFTGVAGSVYHFDLCPDTPGAGTANFDIDIKICDAACTILAGQDGTCTALSYRPNDFQWTCTLEGTYYVIFAPYSSYNSHNCTGTVNSTFTLDYYAEVPILGACCLTSGLCTQRTAAQCTTLGGVYQGNNVPCTPALCPVTISDPCPGALFNQVMTPSSLTTWAFVTSDSATVPPYIVFDNFDVTAPICDIQWWGADLRFDPNTSPYWFECDQVCPKFQINFYYDDGTGKPNIAAPACTYQLGAAAVDTGILYGTVPYHLKHYSVGLNPCCTLTAGWLSIQAIDGDTCWFLWGNAATGGDGVAWQYNGTTWTDTAYNDQAFCLTPDYMPAFGSCCLDVICHDNLGQFECLFECGVWYPGVGCDPTPCEPFGACCFANGSCQYLTPSQCAGQGIYQGDGTPCTPNPCPQPPGEVCSSAFLIPSLPYADSQDSCGFQNNYDETCPYAGSTSKDVVYAYTPAVDEQVTIDLCDSAYDTKVYIYQDICQELSDPNPPYACNDDYPCTLSYRSHLECVPMPAGHTYYIVVDGYGGACGIYNLSVISCGPTGACCREYNSSCDDAVLATNCVGLHDTWYPGLACAQVTCPEPPPTGACCYNYNETCADDVLQANCAGPHDTWYPGTLCAQITCPVTPTGACCVNFVCVETDTEAQCAQLAGEWHLGQTCPTFVCPQPPPANDDCVNALPIGEVTNLPFDTTWATHDGAGTCIPTTSPNVWYCFTATCTATVTIDLCGSLFDTKLAVYAGCTCNPLGTQLGCNDDSGPACSGLQSSLALAVVAGEQYLIEVGGYGSNKGLGDLSVTCPHLGACCYPTGICAQTFQVDCTGGTWHGEWTSCDPNPCPQPPPNDECATAIAIGEVTDLPFDTTMATTSNIGTHSIYKDIFYCYTPSCTGVVTIDLCFTPYFDTKLAVWDGCVCPPEVELAYDDDSGPVTCPASSLESSVKVYVHAGQQYLIQVGAYTSTGGGPGDLTVTCEPADYLFSSATDTKVVDGGNGWADPTGLVWFLYPNNWWNQWWPNEFWLDREKLVTIVFTIQYTSDAPVIAFNYSSELWTDPVNPPLPADDAFVVRVPVPTLTAPGTYTFATTLPLCPRWISMDIQGNVVWIQGTITHICLPPTGGACCYPDGTCLIKTQAECSGQGLWLGPGTTCDLCPPANDNCALQAAITDGSYPYDTTHATPDGYGWCMTSPNIWYCYTAPCTGFATATLTGASYSTMLAVYHDCGVEFCYPPEAKMECCHPNTCVFPVQAGHGYFIEVGGLGNAVGTGTLNVSCLTPLPGACCMPGGYCQPMLQAECEAASGHFFGPGTVCVPCLCATCVGDFNCDGSIDFDDINPFVAVLSGAVPCNFDNGDCNCDGEIDFDDINPFVALLTTGSCPMGACCFPDGTCAILPQVPCTGVWHGEWSSCDPNPCPAP